MFSSLETVESSRVFASRSVVEIRSVFESRFVFGLPCERESSLSGTDGGISVFDIGNVICWLTESN